MAEQVNLIDLEEIKLKMYTKLKPSGWGDKLKTFILSKDFDDILRYLMKEVNEDRRFTPQLKYIFRAFEECPYNELKCVIIGQDPYHFQGSADGIAFSCSMAPKIQSSLKFMFKEIQDTVYSGKEYAGDPDLKRWSNQGILLINSAFTTTINKAGQHYDIWQPFIAFLLDIIGSNNPGIIYACLGRKAQEWMDLIPENNFKLYASHPASGKHTEDERWDSKDLFNQISILMNKHHNYKMKW